MPSSQSNFDPLKQLCRSDIRCKDNLVLVFFKWAKTNQNARKLSWIPISSVSDVRFNLKVHLEKLFKNVNAPGSAPLFTYASNKFHTRNSLVTLLEMCLSEAGLDTSDYSWHSFRRGSAVFAFELGLADSAVQLLGDWSSSAFKNYLEFSYKRKKQISDTIASNFDVCIKNL